MAVVSRARVGDLGRRWLASWGTKETGAAWLFMVPALVGLFVFHMLPLWRAVGYTFTDFDLFSDPTNVGFDNYSRLFSDDQFLRAIRLTAMYVVINVPVQVGIALGLAAILDKVTAEIVKAVKEPEFGETLKVL
ncbi:MAG: carbohydrate ABC transporter permease, partial [Acidimicrobiia bacterium]